MRAKGFKRAIPAIIILLFCSIIGIAIHIFSANGETLYISHESGIYSGSFDLRVFSFRKADIYYTLNGQEPQPGAKGTYEYAGPIELGSDGETATYSFRISCVYEDGRTSEVYNRDYILDPLGTDRFTTNYVVMLTGEEEALFGDEAGIFVRGNQFYEYMEENPDTDVLNVKVPANYYEDVEVPVHTSMFLNDGTQIIEQECGVRIYGNVTRQLNQKSFRLYARYEYDDVNEFSYPFFHDIYTEGGKEPITDWQRLSFHNGGNDNGYAFIRSELMGDLARQSGFQDTMGAESVTVYINGKYQGVYWLQNTFDDRYFKEKYGDYSGEMAVCEGSLSVMNVEITETAAETECAKDYNTFIQWIATADLNDDANWQRVCDTIDVDNFAHYFALQHYGGNLDWPHNNVKVYRYACTDDGEYIDGTVFDGRYRWLLFDTDYCFGLIFLDFFGHDVAVTRMNEFLTGNENATLFRALSQRKEFRDLYSAKLVYLMNTVFTRDNVSNTMYELNVTRYDELNYMVTQTDILKDGIWEAWGVGMGTMPETEQEWANILSFVEERPQYILWELQTEWGYQDAVTLRVSAPEEGSVVINNMSAGKDYSGSWMKDTPAVIGCNLPKGMIVEGYMVNGEFTEGETIVISADEMKEAGQELTVVPVITKYDMESLTVASYSTGDSQDYIVLQNDGTVSLNLNDYALADGEESLSGSSLPSVRLEPGEKFYVYGAKYTGNMEQNSTQVAFSWNDEEQIYLYGDTIGMQVY